MSQSKKSPRFLKFGQFETVSAPYSDTVGTTLTIPGQARDIASLLALNRASGAPFPLHSGGDYDGDESMAYQVAQFESMDEDSREEFLERIGAELRKPMKPEKPETPPPPEEQ